MAIALRPQICDVTSPYVYLGADADMVNVNSGEGDLMVSSGQQSLYSEVDFLLMASLQLGALRTLGALLQCRRYIELLLVPRDSSDGEKRSSTLNAGAGQDDLQVGKSSPYQPLTAKALLPSCTVNYVVN